MYSFFNLRHYYVIKMILKLETIIQNGLKNTFIINKVWNKSFNPPNLHSYSHEIRHEGTKTRRFEIKIPLCLCAFVAKIRFAGIWG